MNRVILGPEYFPLTDKGKPVSNADIYIGNADTDPEIVGNQKTVYVLQENGSVTPVSQPINTGAGGVPLYNGSPVTILVSGDYSLKVLDSKGVQVYYVPSHSQFTFGLNIEILSAYSSLSAAIAAIGTTETELWIDRDETISANLTSGYNINPRFINGNILSDDANNATLTIQGNILAASGQQIFNWGAGSGTVSVSGGKTEIVYPQWWGALGPNESFNATTNRNAINYACKCGAGKVLFNHIFTVNGAITYGGTATYEGRGIEFGSGAGINFLFSASGDTDLMTPSGSGNNTQFVGMNLNIDAASDLGTSGWDITLLHHKGRFSQFRQNFLQNQAGASDGATDYTVSGLRFSYDAVSGSVFDIWVHQNLIQNFDIDCWLDGDTVVGVGLDYCVGFMITENEFLSVATSNTNLNYANLVINDSVGIQVTSNIYNGNGVSGGTGYPNIIVAGISQFVNISNSYFEGSVSGRQKIYLNDTSNRVKIDESMITNNEVNNTSAAAIQAEHSMFSFASRMNSVEIFGGTAGAGSVSRLLDTYDVGTWTPTVGGNAIYSSQTGYYIKIGRLVMISGIVSITTLGTGSTTTLSGLPFTSNDTPTHRQTIPLSYFASIATAVVTIAGWIAGNGNSMDFRGLTAAGSTATGTLTVFQDSTRIDFSGCYISKT